MSHGCSPPSQLCTALPALFTHSGDNSFLPGQSSHGPQGFVHAVDLTHRGQSCWLSTDSSAQSSAKRTSTLPSSVRTVQQPKQSHPLGVEGSHKSTHVGST